MIYGRAITSTLRCQASEEKTGLFGTSARNPFSTPSEWPSEESQAFPSCSTLHRRTGRIVPPAVQPKLQNTGCREVPPCSSTSLEAAEDLLSRQSSIPHPLLDLRIFSYGLQPQRHRSGRTPGPRQRTPECRPASLCRRWFWCRRHPRVVQRGIRKLDRIWTLRDETSPQKAAVSESNMLLR